MTQDELRERLSALAHEQWTGWMEYMLAKCDADSDGGLRIPAVSARRWKRQMETPYAELPEPEKASDRAEADRVLAILEQMR